MYRKHFFTLLYMGLFVLLTACNTDKKQMLINTWHMHHDEMVLELKADGSYTVDEYEKKHIGKWRLSPDGKTIIFSQKGDTVDKELVIEALDENKLILDDNGFDMTFTNSPEAVEAN